MIMRLIIIIDITVITPLNLNKICKKKVKEMFAGV